MADASESIDSHVLRKYDVGQKVGKGVSSLILIVGGCRSFSFVTVMHYISIDVGLWYRLESRRQAIEEDRCSEEDL